MAESTFIVINPGDNHRATGRAWQSCQRQVMRELAPVELALAADAAEAEIEARGAALRGYDKIVAVGGTEIAHGLINGVMGMAEAHRRTLKVGFFCPARPHPWFRTLDLPRSRVRQLEVLQAGSVLPFDVGRVVCHGFDGRPTTRYFLNGAGFGISSRLGRNWRQDSGGAAGRLAAIAATVRDTLTRREPWLALEEEGRPLYRGPWIAGMVMVGKYYPLFGRVAPEADPADGLLDLVGMAGPLGLGHLLRLTGLARHRTAGNPATGQGTEFAATDIKGPIFVDADGLPVGTLPATFEVVPRALNMIVATVPARIMRPKFGRLAKIENGGLAAGNLRAGNLKVGSSGR